jgi:hypothetical protein
MWSINIKGNRQQLFALVTSSRGKFKTLRHELGTEPNNMSLVKSFVTARFVI